MSPHKLKSLHWIKKYSDLNFMSADLYSWTADFTLPIDKPWKTTPKWVFKSWNLCTGSKNTMILLLCQVICTVEQLILPYQEIDNEKISQNNPLHVDIYIFGVLNHHRNLTKPYQTKTNQLKTWIWTWNINLGNFYTSQLYDLGPYFKVMRTDFEFFNFFPTSRARLKKIFSWVQTLGQYLVKSRRANS